MATEQSSPESPLRKRQCRSKPESQSITDNLMVEETEMDTTVGNTEKRSPVKKSAKTSHNVDPSADLYEPGDIVWCKLGSFPWWPALIYRCDAEGGIHTKTLNSNNKPKRLFFVYFYGKYLEYSWISTRWLLKYAGLSNFIQHAEAAVQQATTKSEQQELANRYQLKVSMKKRVQWDEAIELADRALIMTQEERIQEFNDLLKEASDQSQSARRRKISAEKNQDEEDRVNKRHVQDSSISSAISTHEADDETTSVEKVSRSVRKAKTLNENSSTILSEDGELMTKNRGRQQKSEKKNETDNNLSTSINSTINDDQSMKTRKKHLSPTVGQVSSGKSLRKSRRSVIINGNEIEYDYPSASDRPNQQTSLPLVHLIQAHNPPLSNYEQKQIVEGLLRHPKEKTLTFDEAQGYAVNKAIEIVYENHNYRMNHVSPEWFYESILLKYPAVVFKYRSWFEHVKTDVIPNGNDMIKLKQWQIALMLHAQIKVEQTRHHQQQHEQESS